MTQSFITVPGPYAEPPATTGDVAVASLGRRLGAYLLDALVGSVLSIAGAMVAVVIAVIVSVVGGDGSASFHLGGNVTADSGTGELLGFALLGGLSMVVPLLYFSLLPGRSSTWNGQTVGKRATGIRIVRADGGPIAASTARRRALAYFGPVVAAIVVGPVLDAILSTPPVFTFVALGLALAYAVVDLTFAPNRGLRRETIHDRLAGTVVVREHPGQPLATPGTQRSAVTIVDTPTTGRTKLVAVGGAIYLLLVVVGLGLAITSGDAQTGSGDDPVAVDTGAVERESAAASKAYAALVAADFTERATAEALPVIAAPWARCVGRNRGDATKCRTAASLGLADEIIDPLPDGASVTGGSDSARTIRIGVGADGGSMLAVDRNGFGWGLLYANDDLVLFCIDGDSGDCQSTKDHPAGQGIVSDQAVVDRLITVAQSGRDEG